MCGIKEVPAGVTLAVLNKAANDSAVLTKLRPAARFLVATGLNIGYNSYDIVSELPAAAYERMRF